MAIYNEQGKATEEIINSVRDLYSLKLKIPLGNPNLKLIHTNQFLFTELPTDVFTLANMEIISNALNSKYTRFSGYKLNRWYIEAVTITNDNSNFNMELDLNPFASNFTKYTEDMRNIEKAYTDSFNNNQTSNNTQKKIVKSTTTGITLHDVKGLSKSDKAYVKTIVSKALQKVNNPQNKVQQAKAIHEYYKANHVYAKYYDHPKYDSKGFEGCWKANQHNCGDGAWILRDMFLCLGFNCNTKLGHKHYWCEVYIDGKTYYCDQSGGVGQHNWRSFSAKYNNNSVWQG